MFESSDNTSPLLRRAVLYSRVLSNDDDDAQEDSIELADLIVTESSSEADDKPGDT